MKNIRKVFCVLLLCALLCGCGEEKQEAPELLTPVGASMDTVAVGKGPLTDIRVYSAAVAPRYYALCFESDTVIGELPVRLGQEVHAGDPVLKVDVSALSAESAALDAEEAELLSESEYAGKLRDIDMELYELDRDAAQDEDTRYEIETDMQLYDLEYENAEAFRQERLQAIAARRTEIEDLLENTALLSPCDGRVTYLGFGAGQTAGAYDTVCVVTDDSDLTIQSDFVPASVQADAVELYALIGSERYELTAEEIDEAEYARTVLKGGTYLSVFTAEDPAGLTLGDGAAVCAVVLTTEDVLKAPVNAVYEDSGVNYVYLAEGESRVRREVTTGRVSPVEVEITSGLTEGDVIYVGE